MVADPFELEVEYTMDAVAIIAFGCKWLRDVTQRLLTLTNINTLEMVQRRAARCVHSDWRRHSSPTENDPEGSP